MMIFTVLYALMCILWSIFCIRMDRDFYGKGLFSDFFSFALNMTLAPLGLVFALVSLPNKISKREEEINGAKEDIQILVDEFSYLYDGDLSNPVVSSLLTELRKISNSFNALK